MNNLKFSIITASYNASLTIEACINSISNQTYDNYEHIIIDGNSSDSTLSILTANKEIQYISEPDQGISDAMNKGLQLATGDYILFIHADDKLLTDTTLSEIHTDINTQNFPNALFYNIIYGKHGKELKPKGLIKWIQFKNTILHQGAVCKADIFAGKSPFDTNLKIAMDYDFFLKLYPTTHHTQVINRAISFMSDEGVSSQREWLELEQRLKEEKYIHTKNKLAPKIVYTIWWALYPIYKKIRATLST